MRRRQNSKSKKRPKHFHRRQEDVKFQEAMESFPTVVKRVDYTLAAPKKLARRGKTDKGDSL